MTNLVNQSTACQRGQRLKRLRNLANLSRKAMCENADLNINTLKGWEIGRHGGLTHQGAKKILKRVANEGVQCSEQWLLHDTGPGPRLSEAHLEAPEQLPAAMIQAFDLLGNYVYWSCPDGNYLGCNQAFQTLLNKAQIPDIKKANNEQIPWIQRDKNLEATVSKEQRIISTEETLLIENEKIYLQTIKTPFQYGDNLFGVITSAMVITSQKKKNIYFDNLITSLPAFLFWKDQDSIFLGANDKLAQGAGLCKGSELVGKTDAQLTSKIKAKEIRKNDLTIMEKKEAKTFEEMGINPDGKKIHVLSCKSPILDEQQDAIGIIGVSIDINKRKILEQQLLEAKQKAECANKAKSEFLACMSHDLRTPLNGILGISQLLLMSDDATEKQKQLIEDLLKSGSYLKQIVEDILMLAKLESDKLNFQKTQFNLHTLAKEAISKMAFHAQSNNVELILDYNISSHFVGDKNRVSQILMNLLGNAIKFTSGGCVLLAFEKMENHNDKTKIQITVEDTGIGIPDDKINDIFEKFMQVESSYQSRYEGTGLGLSIVRNLAESMDGSVGLHSQLGKGATFWCQLLLKECDNPIDIQDDLLLPEKSKTQLRPRTSKKLNILMIEDDKINQMIQSQFLQKAGFDCEIANSGETAIALCKAKKYNMVFMDLGLPDMTGFQLLANIRQYVDGPIIALTAHTAEEDRKNCLEAGMDDFLSKPLSYEELQHTVAKWLRL